MKSKITLEDLVTVGMLDYVKISSMDYERKPGLYVDFYIEEEYLNDEFSFAVFDFLCDKPVSFFKYDDDEMTVYFEHDIYAQAISYGEKNRE